MVTPTYERGLEFYRLTNPQALANLLWNNLVRFYTNTGIGYIDVPRSLPLAQDAPPGGAELGVGARTDADEVAEGPGVQIVSGLAP